ncbi:MAG: MotA/TolQ/ExbB proton channel family protein, partial [Bacteroidaceae bacterium]|nr:MotA/TolQ/ExbB proton channel family protein [Bacteroidaceae bacterium]
MKKVFAIIALMGVFTFGMTQTVSAQDEEAAADSAATEQVDSTAAEAPAEEVAPAEEEAQVEETGFYKGVKKKFIEGDAGFMALV